MIILSVYFQSPVSIFSDRFSTELVPPDKKIPEKTSGKDIRKRHFPAQLMNAHKFNYIMYREL